MQAPVKGGFGIFAQTERTLSRWQFLCHLFFDSSFGCECGANLVDDLGGRVGRHESGVADAVKTLGQNVLDVSEKEHLGCHFCRSMSPDGIDFWLRGISPEGDGHLLVAQAEDAAIRDGDSVGVPCEVTDNNVGPTVGFSREHHPFLGDFLAKIKKPGIAAVFWRERHVACIHELPQPVEKSSAEGSGKSPDTEEKISLAFAPDFLLGVPGTGRDEGMNVGMKAEILCPSVEDRQEKGSPAHPAGRWRARELKQGVGSGLEEEIQEHPWEALNNAIEFVRQGKDHMKGSLRQEPLGNRLRPIAAFGLAAIGTVSVATTTRGDGFHVSAIAAGVENVAISSRGAAENALQHHLRIGGNACDQIGVPGGCGLQNSGDPQLFRSSSIRSLAAVVRVSVTRR